MFKMSFSNLKKLTGAAFVLAACLSAAPSMARPTLLAQENRPPAEGVPQLNRNEPYQQERGSGGRSEMTQEVRGKVTRISGDQVDIRTSGGTVRTYKISEADQERNKIDVGSEVVLTVRGDEVVAISPAGTRNSGSSSSSSSSSTMRRETTVQQSRPAPAPERPAPYAAPAPEPVRGLW
jgi:antitoxin (DNA-binding transcriptional repressor) of toxin-antitoxin stability system